MAVMLDLIGSSIIGGLLMLTIFRVNAVGVENSSFFVEDLSVQENLRNLVEIVEDDFRKIGFGMMIDSQGNFNLPSILLEGDSSRIRYCGNIHRDTVNINRFDTVTYWLGDSARYTDNPYDRDLWRRENSRPATRMGGGIRQFRLDFIDYNGTALPLPLSLANRARVRLIRIAINLQSPFLTKSMFDKDTIGYIYRSAIWRESRLIARNLTR
jgi:hypothetical protein